MKQELAWWGRQIEEGTLKSQEEPSPEYDYSRQYTSRLTAGQPLYQIYMLEEQEKLVDDVTQHVAEEKDKVSVI